MKTVYYCRNYGVRKGNGKLVLHRVMRTTNGQGDSLVFDEFDINEEAGQMSACEQFPFLLKYIDNPCDLAMKYAMNKSADAISWLKNPSYELQLYAVRQNWAAIKYVKQTPEIQLIAIGQSADAYRLIHRPTAEVTSRFLAYDPTNMRTLKNKSPEIIKFAIEHDGMCIQYLDRSNQRKYAELAIRNTKGKAIQYLRHIANMEMCSLALSYDVENIRYISTKVSEADAKRIVLHDGMLLCHIIQPTSAVCFLAVKQNGNALKYAPNILDKNYLEVAISTMTEVNLARMVFDKTKDLGIKLYLKMKFPELS